MGAALVGCRSPTFLGMVGKLALKCSAWMPLEGLLHTVVPLGKR